MSTIYEIIFTVVAGNFSTTSYCDITYLYNISTKTTQPAFCHVCTQIIVNTLNVFYKNDLPTWSSIEKEMSSSNYMMFHQCLGNDCLFSYSIAPWYLQYCLNSNTAPKITVFLPKNPTPSPAADPSFYHAAAQTDDPDPNRGGNKYDLYIIISNCVVTDVVNSKCFENIDSVKIRSRERGPIWYRSLMEHAKMYGVLVPLPISLCRGNIMVLMWYPALPKKEIFYER